MKVTVYMVHVQSNDKHEKKVFNRILKFNVMSTANFSLLYCPYIVNAGDTGAVSLGLPASQNWILGRFFQKKITHQGRDSEHDNRSVGQGHPRKWKECFDYKSVSNEFLTKQETAFMTGFLNAFRQVGIFVTFFFTDLKRSRSWSHVTGMELVLKC